MEAAPIDLPRAETDALANLIAEHAAHIDAALHRLLTDIRTFDRSGGWSRQGARSCAAWLSWRLGWDGGRAREHVRVANRLGELPLIDDALRKGELSYSKVRAMVRVATPANEASLLVDAQYSTGTQLIAKYDRDDGMVGITVTLHPEEAAAVWEALNGVARELATRKRFNRVDALVSIAEGVLRGDRPDRSPTELVITVAAEVLDGSNPDALQAAVTSEGIVVSAETTRRLACDCGVVHMTEDEHGHPLSVGRKTRSIPASIKRALIKRDSCCRFPGCTNRHCVDGHHIKHWAQGGETSLENMVLVCKYHHRFVHEYGYRVELDAHGEPTFFDPRGRIVTDAPEPARPAWLGFVGMKAENEHLDITARTNAPRWDGEPVNYDWVIEDLCRKDPAPPIH